MTNKKDAFKFKDPMYEKITKKDIKAILDRMFGEQDSDKVAETMKRVEALYSKNKKKQEE